MMATKQTIVTATFTVFKLLCTIFMYLPVSSENQNKNYNEYIKSNPKAIPLGITLVFLLVKGLYAYMLNNNHETLKSLTSKFYTYEIFRNLYVILSNVLFAFNLLFTTIYWICYFINKNMMNPTKTLEEGFEIPMAYKLGAYLAPLLFSIHQKHSVQN